MTASEDTYVAEIAAEVISRLRAEGYLADPRPLMTAQDVADNLNVSYRSARHLIESGVIESVLVGPGEGSRRALPEAVDAYKARQRAKGT